jgi:hypothetical protein
MGLLNVILPAQNRSQQPEHLKDPPYLKPLSGSIKLSVANRPSDNDVLLRPEETFSDGYVEPYTTAAILANSSPTTLPSYFDDVIVGRVACNITANGTEFSAFLDCYNSSYAGEIFNNASGNGSAIGGARGEPLTDVILMGVTSLILGLMILITVIGECFKEHQFCNCNRDATYIAGCIGLYHSPTCRFL